MVFGEVYDRSLWLILHSKGMDNGEIVDFVKNLTNEMYECIRNLIKDYYDGDEHFVSHRQISGKDYLFRVEIRDDELVMMLHKWQIDDVNIVDENFEFTLIPFYDDLVDSRNFHSQSLGSYSSGISCRDVSSAFTFSECYIQEDVSYNLKRGLMNYCLETVYESENNRVSTKFVNIDMMPSKMYPHQFENKERLNRLVRGRRKR